MYFRSVSSSSPFSSIRKRVVIELVCVILCVLWIYDMYTQYQRCFAKSVAELTHPTIQFEQCDFQSGDLLVLTRPHLRPLHPGHLAIVVKLNDKFGQLCVWDLDLYEQSHKLKPLYLLLKESHQHIYWRKLLINKPLNILPYIRPYTDAKYDFRVLVTYINAMFREYTGFPSIPDQLPPHPKQHYYYCSTVILQLLVDLQLCHKDVLLKSSVFCPTTLILPRETVLSPYMLGAATYAPPLQILLQ